MFEFLLLLFIIFIVVPICRVAWTIYKVRRQYRQAFQSARQQYGRGRAQSSSAHERRGGWSVPRRKKGKVVQPEEGEYVEWEEISINETAGASTQSAGSTTENIEIEQRVTDAEWEDLESVPK